MKTTGKTTSLYRISYNMEWEKNNWKKNKTKDTKERRKKQEIKNEIRGAVYNSSSTSSGVLLTADEPAVIHLPRSVFSVYR